MSKPGDEQRVAPGGSEPRLGGATDAREATAALDRKRASAGADALAGSYRACEARC